MADPYRDEFYNPEAPAPEPVPPGGGYLTYDMLGYDGMIDVYQGSDGKKYQGGSGMNGFVPYTGTATTFSQTPTKPGPPEPGGPEPPPPAPGPTPGPAPSFNQQYTTENGPAPSFEPPAYTPPPAFSYGDFVAPTGDDLNDDPLFKLNLKTEQDSIQRSAAARGILNTGGTIYDLLTNARDVATGAYGSMYNRKLGTYETNRKNAADTYRTNYDSQFVDPYQFKYQGGQDAYNANIHSYDLAKSYGWAENLFDWQKDQDMFDRKFRLLSFH